MSEFRQDPLSRHWVIIGSERGGRPNEFVEAATRASGLSCPFCAGHESETPPSIATYSSNGKGKWLVRVVPNKFPAVTPVASAAKPSAAASPLAPPVCTGKAGEGRGTRSAPTTIPGFGSHEVIIESPRHVVSLSDLTDTEVEAVFV